MIYIGIDNGMKGALTALDNKGEIIGMIETPTQKSRKGNEVDIVAVRAWTRGIAAGGGDELMITIEEPGGAKNYNAAVKMAGAFHALRGFIAARGLRWERITAQQWQKVMIPGAKAGDTKPRALEAARRRWPNQTWLKTPRCKVPHDGMVDAALIAEYSRRVFG